EVLNWSIGSRLSEKRYENIVNNLSEYNCSKVLIYTTLEEDYVEKFRSKGIITLEIGYQLLPKVFYNFFKEKGQVTKRKIDSSQTSQDIENKLSELITLVKKKKD
ncbi:MAG: hypothetical protein QXD70_01010, partial [Candidatus Bathyarchaeia archaeon]